MAESEAIEILKKPCLCDYNLSYTVENCDISNCDRRKATITAIKALEEMQEYRALGLTPPMIEDLKKSEKQAHKIAMENAMKLDGYEAIEALQYLLGYENAVDKGELDALNSINSQEKEALEYILEEIKQYRALGTVEELREAMEKQRAKKQGNINDSESHFKLSKAGFLCCCVTNKDIRYPLIDLRDLDYCPRCGQAIDWRKNE